MSYLCQHLNEFRNVGGLIVPIVIVIYSNNFPTSGKVGTPEEPMFGILGNLVSFSISLHRSVHKSPPPDLRLFPFVQLNSFKSSMSFFRHLLRGGKLRHFTIDTQRSIIDIQHLLQ